MHQEYERLVTDYDNIYQQERKAEKFGIISKTKVQQVDKTDCNCDEI